MQCYKFTANKADTSTQWPLRWKFRNFELNRETCIMCHHLILSEMSVVDVHHISLVMQFCSQVYAPLALQNMQNFQNWNKIGNLGNIHILSRFWRAILIEKINIKYNLVNWINLHSLLLINVTLSVKSRLKSKNLIMRKQAPKCDFYHSFHYNFKLWHDYTQSILKIKVTFSQCSLPYEGWFFVEKSKSQKNDFSWVFTEGHILYYLLKHHCECFHLL